MAALTVVTGLLAKRRAGGEDPIPVLFSLPTWPADKDLADWLSAELTKTYAVEADVARCLVTTGAVLPMLDSLDEVDAGGGLRRSAEMVTRINTFAATTVGARLVVVCRSGGPQHQGATRKLRGFEELKVRPLDAVAIVAYMAEHGDGEFPDEWKQLARCASGPKAVVRQVLEVPW